MSSPSFRKDSLAADAVQTGTSPLLEAVGRTGAAPAGELPPPVAALPLPVEDPTSVIGRRGRVIRRSLLVADVVGLATAFALAVILFRSTIGPDDPVGRDFEIPLFIATIPMWILLARLQGLYDRDEERTSHSTLDDLAGVFQLVTVGTFLFFAGAWMTDLARPYPPKLITFWIFAIGLVSLARVGARSFARTRSDYIRNAVIVGADEVGLLIARKILDHPESGVRLVGFVDAGSPIGEEVTRGVPAVGSPAELPEIVRSLGVERVIVSFFESPVEEAIELVRSAKNLGVQVDVVPRLFAAVGPRAQIHTLEGFPLIGLPPPRLWRSSLYVKRGLDIVLSALALVVFAPVFLVIALRIRLDGPGPVFFRHERVGLHGRPFRLVKFRTMHVEEPGGDATGAGRPLSALERLLQEDPDARAEFERTHKLVDDPRVTSLGRLLRRTSLDELPQLVNVLRGDMSLVGPRPVTEVELARYLNDVEILLAFRPGLTGYWQINGRSRAVYAERVRLDMAYVRGWSLKLDFAILGKTALTLIKGDGAY